MRTCNHVRGWGVHCCTLPDLMHKVRPTECVELADYLRDNPLPARPRLLRAAHLPQAALNATYLEQLDRAYRLVQALPHDDPRSLYQQNNFHCMYSGPEVRRQLGFPDLIFSVHTN